MEFSLSESLPWLCVKTQPKREQVAAGQLARLEGVEVFSPRIRFQRRTPRGKVWFDESLFPGYVFARCDASMQRAVSMAIGVRGLVKFAGICAVVPSMVVETLRAEMPAMGPIVLHEQSALQPGDEALVAEGAMMGLRAVITQVMPGGARVQVLMDMMGTAVAAEVPIDVLEKVG